jgi:NAD(P)-dependent dehydrogenase (short-subunit alcohol dehydrogenase family)
VSIRPSGRRSPALFASEGLAVVLMVRNEDGPSEIQREIEDGGGTALLISADATDPAPAEAAFGRVRDGIGDPEVFVYNAGAFQMGGILEIPLDRFDDCFKANCAGELCTPLTNVSSIWAGSGGPKR